MNNTNETITSIISCLKSKGYEFSTLIKNSQDKIFLFYVPESQTAILGISYLKEKNVENIDFGYLEKEPTHLTFGCINRILSDINSNSKKIVKLIKDLEERVIKEQSLNCIDCEMKPQITFSNSKKTIQEFAIYYNYKLI